METPILIMGSFGLMIKSEEQEMLLPRFTKSFELDVKLNPNDTFLQQTQDGVVTAVSKSFIQMCKPNKNPKPLRPTGFVKIQYSKKKKKISNQAISENFDRTTITRPPTGPIPIGAWCSLCNKIGPKFHNEDCSIPSDSSLRVTLYGFITCVVEKNLVVDKDIDTDITELKNLLGEKFKGGETNNKEYYINEFNKLNTEDFVIKGGVNEWPLLNIRYDRVIREVGPKAKKTKSFFSNCSIISHNFPNGSVSIRVYETGLVHFVSCPWEHKSFYIKFIKRLNESEGVVNNVSKEQDTYIINTNESLVKSCFSSFSIFVDDSNMELDLEKLYNYYWPLDENNNPVLNIQSPKRVFTKRYKYSGKEIDHNYLVNPFSTKIPFYRFEIEFRNDLSTKKIIMKMIPCLGDKELPKFCKPYKITVLIFVSGKIQLIFSYCKDEDVGHSEDKLCDENPFITPDNIIDQFKDIQNELEQVMDFLYKSIDKVSNNVTTEANTKLNSKRELVNTVPGILPYRKRTKLKLNEEVELFNEELMDWDRTGTISEINDNDITVELTINDEKTGEITTVNIKNLRPVKQSSMQVARSKIGNTDIENKPSPYEFSGKCTGGDKFYVPFGGTQAVDNLYYPSCSVKKKDVYKMYIDQIISGFPNNEKEEEEFNIEKDAEFDIYSGVLKKESIELGKNVKFKIPFSDEELEGIIIDKRRTNDRKLNNVVIYKIDTGNEEYEIEGKDLLPEYRDDRRWEGIKGSDDIIKVKLLECAKKLGLSQSPYTTERQNIILQNKVLSEIQSLMNMTDSTFIGQNTSVLTPSTFLKFKDRSYSVTAFPSGSQRVIFYSDGKSHYFIDESMMVMKLAFDIENDVSIILDGYVNNNNNILTYYPIDCLLFNGKKMNQDYISIELRESGDINEEFMIEYIDDLDLDSNTYNNLVENLKYGRLLYTVLLSKILNKKITNISVKFANPENYTAPFIGIPNLLGRLKLNIQELANRNIIEDTNIIMSNSKDKLDLTFIPQKGHGNYLRWKRLLKTPVVLELIKKSKSGSTVGIGKEYIKPIGDTPISIPVTLLNKLKSGKRTFLKFDLNFMSNGKLNPEDPLTLDIIEPVVTKLAVLSHKRTQLIVDAMISPIPERVFLNKFEWKLIVPKSILFVPSESNPGIEPLTIQ